MRCTNNQQPQKKQAEIRKKTTDGRKRSSANGHDKSDGIRRSGANGHKKSDSVRHGSADSHKKDDGIRRSSTGRQRAADGRPVKKASASLLSGNRDRQTRLKKQKRQRRLALTGAAVVVILAGVFFAFRTGNSDKTQVIAYETANLNKNLYQGSLFSENLCVTTGNVPLEGFPGDPTLHAAGLFDIEKQNVLYADRLFEPLYPASTTKVMTALLTLKYGNLQDIVTVSENALNLEAEATVCGLQTGDKLSLYDLLCGLVLQSGNDSAIAIAEHISGSVEAFAEKMNEEAAAIGATGSHFVNPHGLHDDNHYTTAYDLYLMFNECLKYEEFKNIISMKSYSATVTYADGSSRTEEWLPTNYYSSGHAAMPEGVTVFGGKTGTTTEAGSCVILYSQSTAGEPYISLMMGADDKDILYNDMSQLLTAGVAVKTQ